MDGVRYLLVKDSLEGSPKLDCYSELEGCLSQRLDKILQVEW